MTEKERKKERKKEERKKRWKNVQKINSMAFTNCYSVNIHSYRCLSHLQVFVSRGGPTRTAYSIFFKSKTLLFSSAMA